MNATYVLQFLFIPQLWQAFSTIVALRHTHRTTTAKATAAVVIPDLVLLLLLFSVIGYYFMRGMQTMLGQTIPI